MLCDHGCRVTLNDKYSLSIQTHPMIVAEYFAETALQDMIEKTMVYDGTYTYDDVKRFYEPQELFDHITELLTLCQSKNSV
jgi:hypothetical protein